MQYVKFGNTGMDVSRICLGMMSFGKPGKENGVFPWARDYDDAKPLFKKAIDLGINYFDTANVYQMGSSEEITGRLVREFGLNRDEIVVATKVHFDMRPGRPNGGGSSRKNIMAEIDHSLKRLDMDYVDLYQIHRLDANTPMEEIMEAVDKVDSGNLTKEEILHPTGWILVGFLMDPRTGLGRWRNFRIPNYRLMEELMVACRTKSTAEILEMEDVKERIEVYNEQTEKFIDMVHENTIVRGNVIISDLRGVDPIYTGNRFMIYSLYPEQNISAWIVSGRGGRGCSAAVGYSILNKTATIDVGSLMLKYNGGGHKKVGTCQFSDENMDSELPKMISDLCEMANA